MGKLNILHHKSYHVYNAENVARVKRDEARARGEEEETDRRLMLAESESRLDRMRKRSRKERDGQGAGEKELDRQLKGLPAKSSNEEDQQVGGSMIVRPTKEPTLLDAQGKHINFWSELEDGNKLPGAVGVDQKALEKALEKQKLEDITRMYIAKKGEGEPKGWYASKDGKSEKERKEGVEQTLERAYKDGEQKRMTDPLALMNSYLQRRSDIISGKDKQQRRTYGPNGREYTPSDTPSTVRGDLSPVVASLLGPKRRRGDPIPPPQPESSSRSLHASHSSSQGSRPHTAKRSVEEEAASRVSSERARAAALIAVKKKERAVSSSSMASDTPRSEISEWGAASGGFGMFNRQETRAAHEQRGNQGSHGGYKRVWNDHGRDDDDRVNSWGEQKRRRDEKERDGWRHRR